MNSQLGGAAELSKRQRTRLAKSEIWLQLAVTAQRWAEYDVDPDDPDPLGDIARRYGFNRADMRRILTSIADQLETKAVSAGYDEVPA